MTLTINIEIPVHLKEFVSTQNYDNYTPIDHAVWRYVMKQNHNFLEDIAHPAFLKGLKGSGIEVEMIPRVSEMNECLSKIGWGAVIVDGLIPGNAFFDLQAHGILPIATDIRKATNIEYTPAPDIIHEAAGHAPILFDETYSTFVKKIGEVGAKAFATEEEHEAFEAVRALTIIKEDPTSSDAEIKEAERIVKEKQSVVEEDSEAERISRLFWWTVEFGLIGDLNNPQIFGAGLLSSVGESKACLSDQVKKSPFSVDACIGTSYDVTTMQKQLFVCKSFEELIEAVDEFSKTMAYRTGGANSITKAIRSKKLATVEYNSGLQVSGIFNDLITDNNGNPIYIKTIGETALAVKNKEIVGHSKVTHQDGLGAPIGLLKGNIALEDLNDIELKKLNIEIGQTTELTFKSGIQVAGQVKNIVKKDNQLVLISFNECFVSYGEKVLFNPQWGTFDMPVGSKIVSAFPGVVDYASFFGNIPVLNQSQTESNSLTELEGLYQKVRDIRESNIWGLSEKEMIVQILAALRHSYDNEWLLRLQILEIILKEEGENKEALQIIEKLQELSEQDRFKRLIKNGLQLVTKN